MHIYNTYIRTFHMLNFIYITHTGRETLLSVVFLRFIRMFQKTTTVTHQADS